MLLRQIFDPSLAQYAYLIGCQRTGEALIIDPQRDIDRYQDIATDNKLKIVAATETHIHADFLSGVAEFAADPGINIYLSAEGGPDWSYKWPKDRANTHLLKNGDIFTIGKIKVEAMHTPGHTPEHICFLITDIGAGADQPMALISGDFLFIGDVGRPDLLETAAGIKNNMDQSASVLQDALVKRLAGLDDYLQVLPGHGAGSSCGKALGAVPFSTIGYERRFNTALKLAIADRNAFISDILHGQPDPPLYFANMKRLNRDGAKVCGKISPPTHLSAEEFSRAALDPTVRILDTRRSKVAFDTKHIPRSINAPLGTALFSNSAGSFLAPDEKILLVLEEARELESAQRQLFRIGFDNLLGWISVSEAGNHGLFTGSISRIEFSKFNLHEAKLEGEIIDVRTSAEFEQNHLSGARSFPYTRIRSRLKELDKKQRFFVHCASGQRATLATSFLQAEGFNVVHIDGLLADCAKK